MLRSRDILAILAAAWLVRMAWKEDQDFFSASMHLAFYTYGNFHGVAPMDVDGDGTKEGLAVATPSHNQTQWKMEILDLKKLHHGGGGVKAAASPFRPPVMVSSSSIPTVATPLKVTTGQVMVSASSTPSVKLTEHDESKFNNKTRHYFCGADWTDASDHCRQACPGGSPTECPDGQKCYADTACDALKKEMTPTKDSDFILTPAGGLPSVVSLWSDGKLRMHSLTGTQGASKLELREMWVQQVALGLFSQYDVVLANGVVVVGGTTSPSDKVIAFDALTGDVLWDTKDNVVVQKEHHDRQRGTTSFARRRSRIVSATESSTDTSLPNCWAAFRHSLLERGLPHSYWGLADATWTAVHLDKTPKPKKTNQKHQKWHQRHHRRGPMHGRPNVLLGHSQHGILVRSLKNGRPLCHLSLLDHVLYGDLNLDGTLDQLQVVTDSSTSGDGDLWVAQLAKQVANQDKEKDPMKRAPTMSNRLCHVLALSGLPAREELFNANLCGSGFAKDYGDHASIDLVAAPPIILGDRQVVIALSNGMVSKYHTQGHEMWKIHGHSILKDFPTWGPNGDAVHTALIEVAKAPYAPPPILLSGEASMVLLSAGTGHILASAHFPQMSQTRPILADLTGDGTTDIIISSNNALWGYQVIVRTGASVLFRILTGLLLMGMALALLRNRFGQRSDKRSTDE
jgi:hypothetical protein